MCGEEYYDPYAETNNFVPFCKTDSLLCSKISEQVTTGTEFCQLVGFPVSALQYPTMRLDHDCFNGKSSVGPKYGRLDIDYKLMNERDYPDPDEDEEDIHPMDWDFIDEDGEDVFDRMGIMIFGGSGWVASLYRNILGPSMSTSRKVYRKYHIGGFVNYAATLLFAALMYELFVNRRVNLSIQDLICKRQGQGSRR